jgi:hypothetical protein
VNRGTEKLGEKGKIINLKRREVKDEENPANFNSIMRDGMWWRWWWRRGR